MLKKIGIVGGGQLGRMLSIEAKKLGFFVTVLDKTPKCPAGQIADKQIIADVKDEAAIRKLASQSDFLTFEVELANAEILEELSKEGIKVNPSADTLNIIKDKFKQKQFLTENKLPVAPFAEVKTKEDILNVANEWGYPLILKAKTDAYDGRGNALIKNPREINQALDKLEGRGLYIEQFIPFQKELAIMVARSIKSEIASFPVVETIHKNNILYLVLVPGRIDKKIVKKAKALAEKTLTVLKGAGVFGFEMFLTKKGQVLINEVAPRVHNSGHYSLEACKTNQFEQHIRAITGMPLGKTDLVVKAAVMINILGDRQGKAEVEGLDKALAIPNISVHIYGKKEVRIERKMGHITAVDKSLDAAWKKARRAREYISI